MAKARFMLKQATMYLIKHLQEKKTSRLKIRQKEKMQSQ